MDVSHSKKEEKAPVLRPCELDLSPVEVARGLAHQSGLVFLDSSAAEMGSSRRESRFSLVAARPVARVGGDLFRPADRQRLRRAIREHEPVTGVGPDLGFPAGGAIGAVDYDGRFQFGLYPEVLIFDHRRGAWLEAGRLSEAVRLSAAESRSAPVSPPRFEFVAGQSRETYVAGVRRIREYIAAGDIYQANLSNCFRAPWPGADREGALALYERLRDVSPAPFAAFLDMGDGRRVLSSSPELFLEISGGAIRTRPIKGTKPRFCDAERDEKSAYDLITSPKEVAELIMITDLERNDLGQICEFGSVRATDLLKLERYAQVFHLVSTVEGTLRPEIDAVEALAACFPGGSITGAPKKRAREIIDELEPAPRGLYTGTIGMFGFNGESRFNIAIRTAVVEDGELHFHVGAGIVTDSVPEAEYEETLHKAAGILRACGADSSTPNAPQ